MKKLANGTPVLGHSFGYEFDAIGNRTTTAVNGRQSVYTPNEENQIAERTVPGALDILGASPSSLVRVNGQTPQRQGDDFHRC